MCASDWTCDLHTHSIFSDGTRTPEALLRLAENTPTLHAVALTDHNTVAGLPDFLHANTSVERVAGCEFSCGWRKREIHMLGLFLPESAFDPIMDFLEGYRRRKEQANWDCVLRLRANGYPVNFEEIERNNRGASINRVHIANALVAAGCVSSVKEAFNDLLKEGGKHYHKPSFEDAAETVRFIRSVGGIAVWAHPLLSVAESEAEAFLLDMIAQGLTGMETNYSACQERQSAFLSVLVKRYGLLPSGGSDFHGRNKPDIRLGEGRGNLHIPFSVYENLRDAAQKEPA